MHLFLFPYRRVPHLFTKNIVPTFCMYNMNRFVRHLRKSQGVKGLVVQSRLNLWDSMDCNPPAYSVHGIFQAGIQVRGAIPSPGDLPHPEIKPVSPALQADSLPSEPPEKSYTLLKVPHWITFGCGFYRVQKYIKYIHLTYSNFYHFLQRQKIFCLRANILGQTLTFFVRVLMGVLSCIEFY